MVTLEGHALTSAATTTTAEKGTAARDSGGYL